MTKKGSCSLKKREDFFKAYQMQVGFKAKIDSTSGHGNFVSTLSRDNAQARSLSPNPNNPWLFLVLFTFLLWFALRYFLHVFAVRPLYYHSLYVWSLCSKVLPSSGCTFVFSQEKNYSQLLSFLIPYWKHSLPHSLSTNHILFSWCQ